jgi:nicotinate-nucleotide pyrophosphorylase (carboxylating)
MTCSARPAVLPRAMHTFDLSLESQEVRQIIAQALLEDIGAGDITTALTIPADAKAVMRFVAREELVVCGGFIPAEVYGRLSASIRLTQHCEEGHTAKPGEALVSAEGDARALLTGERVALNLMQRMSGVSTLTRNYVDAIKGTKAIILDTRKTMPGLRVLDKYAVRVGGGQNHRFRLDDMVLIKDNHIAVAGSISAAVRAARQHTALLVEVECDTLEQVREAISAQPDRILLDNMSLDQLREAVKLVAGNIPLEASGGVSLESIKAIADTGVAYISVGKLTHSALAVDMSADMVFK